MKKALVIAVAGALGWALYAALRRIPAHGDPLQTTTNNEATTLGSGISVPMPEAPRPIIEHPASDNISGAEPASTVIEPEVPSLDGQDKADK